MDRVEAAEPLDGEARCGVEQHVIQSYELDPLDDLERARGRRGPVMPDRSEHFDACERTRCSGRSPPHVRA